MEYSANCGGNFCPAIGSNGVIFADLHLALFCFVLVSSYLRSCLTVLCVSSFCFATLLASPAATYRLPGWGCSGCETLFRSVLRGKENCSEEAEAWGNTDSHRRFGGTCDLRLQVEGHGSNMRIAVISHAVVCSWSKLGSSDAVSFPKYSGFEPCLAFFSIRNLLLAFHLWMQSDILTSRSNVLVWLLSVFGQ